MKRMLINATQPEELRVAIADGQKLLDLDIEVPSADQRKSNIYKGRITRVEPSLEACFVDYGADRHGFLPIKEVARQFWKPGARKSDGKPHIRECLSEGQELVVQVVKEERGNKGAALTTYISLAGRYLVLMPTNARAGGVSRRITGDERQELKDNLDELESPKDSGVIVRTAGVGRDTEELQWDLDYLVQLWTAIEKAADAKKAPFLIYQESNLIIRALRDYLRADIGEILIDSEPVYGEAKEFVQQVMPHNLRKLKLYRDQVPLFSRYQIESQIDAAFAREVRLPSGGSVVFDHTEAMLSIDINSSRATKGSDIEETAYHTNLEAAEEIARQLRLRDLGGLIVIDFIDMNSRKNQRNVENKLKEASKIDKARVQIGRISRFGLLEMSRQRLRPSLGESSKETCPRCDGHGRIRSIESQALSMLRLIEEEAMKDHTVQVVAQAPINIANFLLNEKREVMASIEGRHQVSVTLIANENLERPRFQIDRIRQGEDMSQVSYARGEELPSDGNDGQKETSRPIPVAPAVNAIRPSGRAPERPNRQDRDPAAEAASHRQVSVPGKNGISLWGKLMGAVKKLAPEEPQQDRTDSGKSSGEQQGKPKKQAGSGGKQRSGNRRQSSRGKPDQESNDKSGKQQSRGRRRGGRGQQNQKSSDSHSGKQQSQRKSSGKPASSDSKQQSSDKQASSKQGDSDQPKRRRRRRRGGRGRGRGRGGNQQQQSSAQSQNRQGRDGSSPRGEQSGSQKSDKKPRGQKQTEEKPSGKGGGDQSKNKPSKSADRTGDSRGGRKPRDKKPDQKADTRPPKGQSDNAADRQSKPEDKKAGPSKSGDKKSATPGAGTKSSDQKSGADKSQGKSNGQDTKKTNGSKSDKVEQKNGKKPEPKRYEPEIAAKPVGEQRGLYVLPKDD